MTQQKTFTNYQRMLTFVINLCYDSRDFMIERAGNGWKVRYA